MSGDGSGVKANEITYISGFGNEHASEALPGALPIGQNSPQRVPYGLYAEQITGTAFTAPRAENQRTWLYRIRPTVKHKTFQKIDRGLWRTAPLREFELTPNRMRWEPTELPAEPVDFVQGMRTVVANGDPEQRVGAAIHIYTATKSMENRVFANHEGEFVIVPYSGSLRIVTELGILDIMVGEIALIPRAVKFRVELSDGPSQGFVCENYGQPMHLPELGPLGGSGMTNPRDFLAPVARYEDSDEPGEVVVKFGGNLWSCEIGHSPFDVVAWHGTQVPYKYNLLHFNVVNSVSFDHTDPSIFTILTSASGLPGTANVEFVAFPPRWIVGEHTFRPPWFHRNVMSEFVGMIQGASESRAHAFAPGSHTLHNSMAAHGPDPMVFEKATAAELKPERLEGILALFESRFPFRVAKSAIENKGLLSGYDGNWDGLKKHFSPHQP